MVLLLGTLFLSVGIIALLPFYLYRKVPKLLSYIITFAIGFIFLFTATVHGIWLGLSIFIIGFFWLRFVKINSINQPKANNSKEKKNYDIQYSTDS